MNMKAIWLRLILICIYVCLALSSYLSGFTVLLMLLGMPWSIPLMVLSGLIFHMTVAGETVVSVGSMIGIMLNIGLYSFIFLRRK